MLIPQQLQWRDAYFKMIMHVKYSTGLECISLDRSNYVYSMYLKLLVGND